MIFVYTKPEVRGIMKIYFDDFDWDEGNISKCKKHGVVMEVIEDFFQGSVFVSSDLKHSEQEERFLALGDDRMGRPMIVAFTFREREGQVLIRPISARYMHKKEARRYDEAFKKNKR